MIGVVCVDYQYDGFWCDVVDFVMLQLLQYVFGVVVVEVQGQVVQGGEMVILDGVFFFFLILCDGVFDEDDLWWCIGGQELVFFFQFLFVVGFLLVDGLGFVEYCWND